MNTLSPILNGGVENPSVGVVMKQVKIPVELDSTFWILIPLVFLVAYNATAVSGIPFGFCIILTEFIVFPDRVASSIPLLIFSPVSVFTITIDGASVYPLPPFVTITESIVFEFLIIISGDTAAIGCKVLSDEYWNPSSIILTSFAFPMDVDFEIM